MNTNVMAVTPNKQPWIVVEKIESTGEVYEIYGPYNSSEEAYNIHDKLLLRNKESSRRIQTACKVQQLAYHWML